MDIAAGSIVYSKAGRDKGGCFVVVGLINAQYVYICDGKIRRVEKPKRKKVKHLKDTGHILKAIDNKLANDIKVTNSEIRKSIAAYLENELYVEEGF